MSPHQHSLSHPAPSTRRHVKYPSDCPRRLPLTPPLTPSSSINNSNEEPIDSTKDNDTRIVRLSNLTPTLDPALLEHTIHQILASSSRIKGLNTRSLQSTHSVPVVFFDSRDARSLLDSVSNGTSLLHPLANSPDVVGAQMISIDDLVKDIGPSSFVDSIDPLFHLRVHPTKKINMPILQSLLASFGQVRNFGPKSKIDLDAELIYHIDYFDSRDADRAILELDGKVLFGMSLAVNPPLNHEVLFPSIAPSHADTCQNPFPIGPPGSLSNLRVRFRADPPTGFPDWLQLTDPAATVTSSELELDPNPTVFYASSSPALPSLPAPLPSAVMHPSPDSSTAANSPSSDPEPPAPSDSAIHSSDGIPNHCPAMAPPPPSPSPPAEQPLTPVVPPSYPHYGVPQNLSDPVMSAAPPDSGIVYYPSLSLTPAPAPPITTGYEYLEAHYAASTMTLMQGHSNLTGSTPPWGAYDPSMIMPLPLPLLNMNMGMGMVPMGVNMNMSLGLPLPPHPHGYYEGGPGSGGTGRGYVLPYGHPPPPHPQTQCQPQYQPQYMNTAGVYGHLQPTLQQYQNQRFESALTSRSGSGSSVGSSSQSTGSGGRVNGNHHQGRGTPPPLTGTGRLVFGRAIKGLGYREKDRGEGLCLSEHQSQHQKARQRDCSCSREGRDAASAPPLLGGIHYDDDGDSAASLHIRPSTEPCGVSTGLTNGSTSACTLTAPSERNQLNIKRIEDGVDTRTTVMIKNIPNKMSDRDLMVFIERVCPRRIDFFYLRMDFQNGCNVGYAFVNFIHVQDLLGFAKARLGVKWNMFSSEKVLQMSYANYQGKEALVEKFKNSAIMDEREAWRPRIFYSSGPSQGLPEPFPPPTHMRRKERSFFNRGALFVPGSGGGEKMSCGEERRGMRLDGKDGTDGLLNMRGLSGLTFGKSWMGRPTEEGEKKVFGGGV